MIHQDNEYIQKTFNEVNTLTAVCKSCTSGNGCEYKEYNSAYFDIYKNGKIIEYTRNTRFWAPYLKDMYLDCNPEKKLSTRKSNMRT